MTNGNSPAFPYRLADDEPIQRCENGEYHALSPSGLSKREYFAGLAMQGMVHDSRPPESIAAQWAVSYADALIDELAKEKVWKTRQGEKNDPSNP